MIYFSMPFYNFLKPFPIKRKQGYELKTRISA